jgi:hypothetical protein
LTCPRNSTSREAICCWVTSPGRGLVVDTLGLLLTVSISAASVKDRDAVDDAVTFSMGQYPSLNTLFVDSAYTGGVGLSGRDRFI